MTVSAVLAADCENTKKAVICLGISAFSINFVI